MGDLHDLPTRLREIRQEIAEKIGISERAYIRYETGEREPRLDTLIELANIFVKPLDVLTGRKKIVVVMTTRKDNQDK